MLQCCSAGRVARNHAVPTLDARRSTLDAAATLCCVPWPYHRILRGAPLACAMAIHQMVVVPNTQRTMACLFRACSFAVRPLPRHARHGSLQTPGQRAHRPWSVQGGARRASGMPAGVPLPSAPGRQGCELCSSN